jgi:dienelactone hydrolase
MLKLPSTCVVALAALALSQTGCAHDGAAKGERSQTPAAAPATPPASSPVAAAERPAASTAIETKEVSYDAGTTHLKGFLAYPPASMGKRPGVLVVHEWWGLNDYTRMRAKKLAELGYVGFAIDMYGDGKQASHPDDAKKFMTEVMSNLGEGVKRFEAAKTLLASDARVDSSKISAIGYCFGGGIVLHMARIGSNLRAVASFHGMLGAQTPIKPGAFAGEILVATGGSDPFVPKEQVDAFEKEMKAAGIRYDLAVYPQAKHAFTNPDATAAGQKFGLPLEYNAEADADSWQKLEHLLARL